MDGCALRLAGAWGTGAWLTAGAGVEGLGWERFPGTKLSLRLGEKMKDEVGVLRVKAAGAVWGWNNTWEELGAGMW